MSPAFACGASSARAGAAAATARTARSILFTGGFLRWVSTEAGAAGVPRRCASKQGSNLRPKRAVPRPRARRCARHVQPARLASTLSDDRAAARRGGSGRPPGRCLRALRGRLRGGGHAPLRRAMDLEAVQRGPRRGRRDPRRWRRRHVRVVVARADQLRRGRLGGRIAPALDLDLPHRALEPALQRGRQPGRGDGARRGSPVIAAGVQRPQQQGGPGPLHLGGAGGVGQQGGETHGDCLWRGLPRERELGQAQGGARVGPTRPLPDLVAGEATPEGGGRLAEGGLVCFPRLGRLAPAPQEVAAEGEGGRGGGGRRPARAPPTRRPRWRWPRRARSGPAAGGRGGHRRRGRPAPARCRPCPGRGRAPTWPGRPRRGRCRRGWAAPAPRRPWRRRRHRGSRARGRRGRGL